MTPYIKDLALRVVATFAFAFLSVLSFTDLSTSKDAAIAGAAAAAEVVRGWLGKFVGDPNNAGFHK
ncbi:holin [Streptomyces phage Dennebes]|nr:holin [Streptomyces phage Dennebes]